MIQIGARPDAGFDDPLRMLSDCHRRIERFLKAFLHVARHAGESPGPDERAQLAAALRYFAESGPLHTRDEEESLFPRLRARAADAGGAAPTGGLSALETLERLERDHDLADAEHEAAGALARRWLAEGRLRARDRARLVALLESLQGRYRAHIALEDTVLFPLAAGALRPDEVRSLGDEMRRRRGLG